MKQLLVNWVWKLVALLLWVGSHLSLAAVTGHNPQAYAQLSNIQALSMFLWAVALAFCGRNYRLKKWNGARTIKRGLFLTVILLSGLPWALACSLAYVNGLIPDLWPYISPATLLGSALTLKALSEDWSKP